MKGQLVSHWLPRDSETSVLTEIFLGDKELLLKDLHPDRTLDLVLQRAANLGAEHPPVRQGLLVAAVIRFPGAHPAVAVQVDASEVASSVRSIEEQG